MLQWNLINLLTDKGVPHPGSWMVKHGIGYERAKKLLNGEASEVKLSQISMLCRHLRCTPNDLVLWKQDKDPLPPNHPLMQLHKPTGSLSATENLRNLNMDELELVKQFMEELIKRRKG